MNLTNLKKLAEAATLGPWEAGNDSVWNTRINGEGNSPLCICEFMTRPDSSFIAAANPQTILAMIEVMEQMGEELHILHGVFPSNALVAYNKLKEGE